MRIFARGFITLLFVALLAGCSNKPGDEAIRVQVSERLQGDNGALIFDVINFQKINGIPRDENTYIAEVEYDLRFKISLDEAADVLQKKTGSIFTAGVEAARLGMKYGDFKVGDTVHRKEKVRFIRTEKGWIIDSKK